MPGLPTGSAPVQCHQLCCQKRVCIPNPGMLSGGNTEPEAALSAFGSCFSSAFTEQLSSHHALLLVVRLAGSTHSFLTALVCHGQRAWCSRPSLPQPRPAEVGLTSGAVFCARSLTSSVGHWKLGAKMERSLTEGSDKKAVGWAGASLSWPYLNWCLAGSLLVGQTCGSR